jgi:hypothetical protein
MVSTIMILISIYSSAYVIPSMDEDDSFFPRQSLPALGSSGWFEECAAWKNYIIYFFIFNIIFAQFLLVDY